MNNGFIKLHRSLMDSSLWAGESFTRGQAWVDLLMLTNYAPGHIRKRGIKMPIERGQCGWSELALSKRWGWSRGKVRRFLEELEGEQQVSVERSKLTQVVTVKNYEIYQSNEQHTNSRQTTNGQQTGTNNKKKKKNEEQYSSSRDEGVKDSGISDGMQTLRSKKGQILKGQVLKDFFKFWDVFNYKKGKREAADSWLDVYSAEIMPEIIAGARSEAKRRHDLNEKGLTPKMAQGWLSGHRWEDEQSCENDDGWASSGDEGSVGGRNGWAL